MFLKVILLQQVDGFATSYYAMVQATGKSSSHGVKKIKASKEMLRSFREISHFLPKHQP